jgi:multiple sugar transport system substrate-binding protein
MAITSVSRREFFKKSATVGVGLATLPLLANCTPAPAAPPPAAAPTAAPAKAAAPTAAAPAAFNWQRFKGEKIEITFTQGNLVDVLMKNHKEFEELTGITVGAEQIPEQQARQKQVMEFNAGATSFDVCHYSYHVHKRMFAKNKWTLDLRDYLKDPTMTPAEFDWDDFSPGAKAYATDTEGRICSIPIKVDFWMLYWNKELFQAKGIAYPKSFDEMLEAAKKLHDPSKNVVGYLARGLKNANVPVWTHLMQGWGVDPIDPKGNFFTESPEALEAAKLYQSLLKNYSAAGASGFNWNECQSAFVLGQAAMWQDGIGFATPLEDKTKSKVFGKVGYGVFPKGPKAQHSAMFGDGIGVSSFSKKKGPAYFYCLWATNKINQLRVLQAGAAVTPRSSALSNPDRAKGSTMPAEYFECLEGSGKILRAGLPEIIPVTEFRDIFGIALTNMIGGADPAAELKKATADFKPIFEKSEKG